MSDHQSLLAHARARYCHSSIAALACSVHLNLSTEIFQLLPLCIQPEHGNEVGQTLSWSSHDRVNLVLQAVCAGGLKIHLEKQHQSQIHIFKAALRTFCCFQLGGHWGFGGTFCRLQIGPTQGVSGPDPEPDPSLDGLCKNTQQLILHDPSGKALMITAAHSSHV